MKKLLICSMILAALNSAAAQDITGSWLGTIPAGGANLRLVFNISKSEAGYSATFDSPDQKAFGIGCSKTILTKDSLHIEIAAIGGSYNGVWNGKDAMNGIYKQGGGQIPLDLRRISAEEKAGLSRTPDRPQTPKPPFNYFTQDVEYDNADKSVHYGATFSRPNGDGKYPAVIIISGSGTQDRDGTIFGHKIYWVLADYLTKNGIAVLRVDDRGAGKSTLGPDIKNATSLTFSYDVEASLNYLETRPDIDKKHLGLIGHSEGGMIAPMVAARRKDVSFIVMWGASVTGGAQINTEQNAHALKNAGVDETAIRAFSDLNMQILSLFSSSATVEALDAKIPTVFAAWKSKQTPATLTVLHADKASDQDIINQYNRLYNMPWMRYFITYNPVNDLSRVKCPVLAINGGKDTQVDAASNLKVIQETIVKNGNKNVEVKILPGLNHLLQTAKTGDVSEYEQLSESVSPEAMKIIADWVKIHTK
ncbi:MAG: alpha/beta hydrolase family protein [Mucilaginibacter sp.]